MNKTAKVSCIISIPIEIIPCREFISPFSSSTFTAYTVLEKLNAKPINIASLKLNDLKSAKEVYLKSNSIPANRILFACLQAWLHTFQHTKRFPSETYADLEMLTKTKSSEKDGPVTGYRAICHLLSERKRS